MLPRIKFAAVFLISAFGHAQADTYTRADGVRIDAKVLDARGCAPLAIISHGLGGSLSGNAPLASALNRAGYRVVVPSHPESGPELLRQSFVGGRAAIARAAADPKLLQFRLDDITTILDAEMRRCAVPFKVLAGHSMGSRIVNIEAGAGNGARIRGRDRFDAYISISPLGEGGSGMFPRGAYSNIPKPMLMITGTQDSSVDGSYETRLSAFEGLSPGRKRLAVIDGARHSSLGGRGEASVGNMVGVIAVEFLRQIRPGPWAEPGRRAGVLFAEK
ncbi:MAG: alpha/beta hydrolase family protein [Rhabdaerophilum sp.]